VDGEGIVLDGTAAGLLGAAPGDSVLRIGR